MASLEELRAARLAKLKILQERNINPFSAESFYTHTIKEAVDNFDAFSAENKIITLAGRVLSFRGQGALIFVNFFDGTETFQALLKKDDLTDQFTLFNDTVDIGDFIELTGSLFLTKTQQKTIQVSNWRILTKSLRPLPDKWDGLQNEEEKLRKRYLDILSNKEVSDLIVKKSVFWKTARDFMEARGFMGVETPVIENTTGGAEARPFITHYNAFDADAFLRISPELWLKRLIVAGYPKVYEIGRIFRNEGIDADHVQDYTQLEFYWAFSDYRHGMKLVQELYRELAQQTFGTQQFNIRGFEVDLSAEWKNYDYVGTIEEMTGINVMQSDVKTIENKLQELAVDYDKQNFNWNRATDTLWKWCRKKIGGPGFLINVPVAMEPLAKRMEDNDQLVERFQVIIAGTEMGKGFSELNDPIDQLGRFEHQAELRAQGDDEAQMMDSDFVEALEYGMPPTFGFGVSERLFSVLAGKPLRETQIFPFMRKIEKETGEEK